MKKIYWLLILILVIISLLLAGCPKDPTSQVEEDGSVRQQTDPNAPKTITSKEIVSFHCAFSAVAMLEEDTHLAGRSYRLEVTVENDRILATYHVHDRYCAGQDFSFEADPAWLAQLQEIVTKYDFAQHNGYYCSVSGLPDQYGAELRIRYVSGETITASDNQNCFLPVKALEELESLFLNHGETEFALLGLSMQAEMLMESNEKGCCSVQYPCLTLGYTDFSGDFRNQEDAEVLCDALDTYNHEAHIRQTQIMGDLKQALPGGTENTELYAQTNVFVTRSDALVLSFYEQQTSNGLLPPGQVVRRTYNLDGRTGICLGFDDVFTDTAALPALLSAAFAQAYPELPLPTDTETLIREALENGDERLGFALTYGGVYICAEGYWLAPSPEGPMLLLSFADYPELVRKEYQVSPGRWMRRPEYDVDTLTADGLRLQLHWQTAEELDDLEGLWTATVNGEHALSCSFYGQEPVCHVLQAEKGAYLYLEIPSGGVSARSQIYRITENGLVQAAMLDWAIKSDSPLDPNHMAMVSDELIYPGNLMLMVWGWYGIDENGMPMLSEGYGLMSRPLVLNEDVEVMKVSLQNPEATEGTVTVWAGTQLTPFRTDLETYLDLMDEEGNGYRFTIDGFSDDMKLPGYPNPDELFS